MADNEFGYTTWGRDWVRLAEPLHQRKPDPKLPRARSIARNSGVSAEIEGRIVRAHIHRGGQASVTHLELEPLSRTASTTIADVLTPEPALLTDDMHRAVLAAGTNPAPVLSSADCSCSPRSARCVHIVATAYEMARRVDENPRLTLELQGYDTARTAQAPGPGHAGTEPPRWTPLNSLDPMSYFAVPDD